MSERSKIEISNYGKFHELNVIRKDREDSTGMPRTRYSIDFGSTPFPILFNSVQLKNDGITVFTFTGHIFAGRGKQLSFNIHKVPNGVVNAEIVMELEGTP